MHTTKCLSRTFHIVAILNVCKLGIREMFTKQCKSLGFILIVISPWNFFTWQGGTPINKFPKPMFRKHHAHFKLPKVKVATIKFLHDFRGFHLKKRHFEHKCYKKLFSKNWKLWKKSLTTYLYLKRKTFNHLQVFYYISLRFHLKLAQWEKLSLTHLKLHTFNNSKSFLPHILNFQWIEELSSTHFHLESWYFKKTWRNLFHTLSPWKLIL